MMFHPDGYRMHLDYRAVQRARGCSCQQCEAWAREVEKILENRRKGTWFPEGVKDVKPMKSNYYG